MNQKRIGDYGVRIGSLPAGPRNKLSDVPGVTVGHWTLHDDTHHTGVTVILPGEENIYLNKCVAASYVVNGYGKTAGLVQIDELGVLESPIALTGTLNVGLVHDALVQYTLDECAKAGVSVRSVNPVVGECNDGTLGDNSLRAVGCAQVMQAIAAATVDFDEGAVGAGAGMICHELKGGIGSASRRIRLEGKDYMVGVLVQANHGQLADLRINGENVGPAIRKKVKDSVPPRAEEKGSCMIILATDLPLSDRQLRRVIKRCAAGLVRNGSYLGHGSGDVCIGFTTANRLREGDKQPLLQLTQLNEGLINRAFRAAAEAAEEAVLNAMVSADGVTGKDGVYRPSLREFL
ncbi:MAG: P1 family peptidase [Faecalibacterium sp.]|nr:P1 family peptidase [Faecalibacterium sp.]